MERKHETLLNRIHVCKARYTEAAYDTVWSVERSYFKFCDVLITSFGSGLTLHMGKNTSTAVN